jgi:SAM-dependent methyltransferase
MRKGWFIIPGVQDGEVTIEDQMIALWPAVAECKEKTVLDIGCAEGFVGREFAKAGAESVTGLDSIEAHLEVAREQCAGLPMTFVLANINEPQPAYFADIVLCLNVAHKLRDPAVCIRFAADSSLGLVLIRSGRGADENGIMRSKHYGTLCDSHAIMRERGFVLEKVVDGPKDRHEPVEYFRRTISEAEQRANAARPLITT